MELFLRGWRRQEASKEQDPHRVDGLHDPGCCGDAGSVILPVRMHCKWLSVHCLHLDIQLPQGNIFATWDRRGSLDQVLPAGLCSGCFSLPLGWSSTANPPSIPTLPVTALEGPGEGCGLHRAHTHCLCGAGRGRIPRR